MRAEIFLADNPHAIWVTTAAECVARLQENWDEVHLDHDLGGKQFVDSEEPDCGMEVVRWLCKEPCEHLRPTLFFIHTHNLVAGLLMVMEMRTRGFTAEFRPFGHDLERILSHNAVAPAENTIPEPDLAPPDRGLLARLRSWRKGKKPAADAQNEPESIGRV